MTVTITVTDAEVGKVDVFCDVRPPDVLGNTACDMSRLVAWSMLYTAERWLINSPVRRCGFSTANSATVTVLLEELRNAARANRNLAEMVLGRNHTYRDEVIRIAERQERVIANAMLQRANAGEAQPPSQSPEEPQHKEREKP